MEKRYDQAPEHISVGLDIKALNRREFEGHGSIFGNIDLGGDVVMSGAFKRTLAEHKAAGTLPAMFWMHQPDQVAGVWKEMYEDERGLFVKGELADTQLGNEMRTLLQMKAVRGLSIGYRTVESDFGKDGVRLLKDVDLWEVSIVSLAMNPLAQVEAAKSRLSAEGEYVPPAEQTEEIIREALADGKKQFERSLRDAGYSRKLAQTIIARYFDKPPAEVISVVPRSDSGGDVGPEAAEIAQLYQAFTEKVQAAALAGKMRRYG